jgi:hypothetical protein
MSRGFLTQFAHAYFGGLTGILAFVHPVLAIINTASYITCKLVQLKYKKDQVYEDILDFTAGLAIGEILILIMTISRKLGLLFP